MHTLIVGSSDIGGSGLIDRLLTECRGNIPLYGYRSVKENDDGHGRAPVYIYPASGKRVRNGENLLGYCARRASETCPGAFERNIGLITDAGDDGLLVMDEIGTMEARSPVFAAAIMRALDGETPVLAYVRDKDTPFLRAVRAHPRGECFYLRPDNAEDVFRQAAIFLREQLRGLA